MEEKLKILKNEAVVEYNSLLFWVIIVNKYTGYSQSFWQCPV